MYKSTDLVSPKQVARAIGVSESSLKRWCDQGLIKTVRTPGGHRKMTITEVLKYIREKNLDLVSPELLGLPPASKDAVTSLALAVPRLVDALLVGHELVARQIVFDLYLAGHSRSVIFDEVIAAAFREIGERWACQTADVYQERRGCEIMQRILFDLRRVQQVPEILWLATGSSMEGDPYSLPTTMAEQVLRDTGFYATSMGSAIPIASLVKAVEDIKPKLFWLSVSHIPKGFDFVEKFATLSQSSAAVGTALVVGGRALTEDLRQRMTYSAYCDTMQHLESFATTLLRSSKSGRKKSSRDKPKTRARAAKK